MSVIDEVIRKEKGSPTDAWRRINRDRRATKVKCVHKTAVHRYANGATHKRGAVETRGRKRALSKGDVRKLELARRRLIKKEDNQHRVTYEDIIEEASLTSEPCQRVCEDALRNLGVSYKHPRSKIQISDKDAKQRLETAEAWLKRPSNYWTKNVHAYVDNKAFPTPLTPSQRARYRQTLIGGHLRKSSEGTDKGFTKPREKHSFIGLPSVTITAAVAKDRVILWHEVPGAWNGDAAAGMYEKHLKPALRRVWGKRARYTIVEDGDRKGNASGRGVAAKTRSKIVPLTLPPRTPSLMPLDYAIWKAIMNRMLDSDPTGTEATSNFLKRLRTAATSLPKGFVKGVIGRMRENIKALKDARGYTPKND